MGKTKKAKNESCHTYPNTYPNDKLLQPYSVPSADTNWKVVIPIQTISFYNSPILLDFEEVICV